MGKSRLILLSAVAALVPWVLAVGITAAVSWLTADGDTAGLWAHDLLSGPMLAQPLAVLLCFTLLSGALRHYGLARRDTWWLGAGGFATLAFLITVVGGSIIDGGQGAAWAAWWTSLSGYVLFVFLVTAYAWTRATDSPGSPVPIVERSAPGAEPHVPPPPTGRGPFGT
ncbi:hypothetical protein [Streptomyces otsuchiensis]|uniref:hypothetical protein n=1 Tax=Streptomyces otsuchiensis TaxID=2681388 RepID=UPI001031386A|nr:hypothetical protein [Streptomyces otsuchiensis]